MQVANTKWAHAPSKTAVSYKQQQHSQVSYAILQITNCQATGEGVQLSCELTESKHQTSVVVMISTGPSTCAHLCIALLAALIFYGVYHILFHVPSKKVESYTPSGLLPFSRLPSRDDWSPEHLPEFCRALILNPQPRSKECRRSTTETVCKDGSFQMFGQYYQDYYVYARHFRHLKRRGIYLDIAGNEPMHNSNTFFMDKCLGWTGLCAEANPEYLEKLFRVRTCALVPTCISNEDSEIVNFALNRDLSGVVDTNKNIDPQSVEISKTPTIPMRCTTAQFVSQKYNLTVVDFLSLDVEGHELQVLEGFDWDNMQINVMVIETSKRTLPGIRAFLQGRGYVQHNADLTKEGIESKGGLLSGDALFLHKSVLFGRPT